MSNLNAVFQFFRCSNCDAFFKRTFKLQRHLTMCSERVKNFYPRSVYQIQETLFYTLDSFGLNSRVNKKNFQKFSNHRIWIILFWKGVFQTNRNNNVDWGTCPDFCIYFFKHCGRINFGLQLWSSLARCILCWSSWKYSFSKQVENIKTCTLLSKQQ